MPTTEEFREEAEAQIGRAARQGRPHIEINAGELHRIVSPDQNRHSMACNAMRQLMGPADLVIYEPPAGDGPSFTVRYALPR
ncbi:hypothetical protein ABIB82_006498 [Bradyrhizobium sp. i1.8.4]